MGKIQYRFSRVYVEVTSICNRNCSFCPGTRRPARRMTEEEFGIALDKLRPYTEYIYLHVMGEPLTHPLLKTFIEMGNARGFKVAITTNGTLLKTRGDDIISAGAYKVNISVHSFEDGDDADYLEYVNNCMDFADKASSNGVLSVLRLWNKGFDNGRNSDILKRLRERFPSGEWREGAGGYRIRHKLHLEYGDRFEWPDATAPDYGERVFCHGLGDHIAVLSDGRIVPCCLDRDGEITLGNIFEDELSDVLSSPRAAAMCEGFKNKTATEELCRRCGYARRFKL